jgi:hypothetical protein
MGDLVGVSPVLPHFVRKSLTVAINMSSNLPPLVHTDEAHQAASILIATAVLLFTTLLLVSARLFARASVESASQPGSRMTVLGLDDVVLVAATVCPTSSLTMSCGTWMSSLRS